MFTTFVKKIKYDKAMVHSHWMNHIQSLKVFVKCYTWNRKFAIEIYDLNEIQVFLMQKIPFIMMTTMTLLSCKFDWNTSGLGLSLIGEFLLGNNWNSIL